MTTSGCTGWSRTCWRTSRRRSIAGRGTVPRTPSAADVPAEATADAPADAPEPPTAPVNDDCLKLTTYFGERDRTPEGLLSDELMDVYGAHRLQASMLLRGVEGFGRLQHLHTDRLLSLSEDLPVVSIAIDERHRIESVLDPVLQIKRRGLITLERARLLSGEIGASSCPSSSARRPS